MVCTRCKYNKAVQLFTSVACDRCDDLFQFLNETPGDIYIWIEDAEAMGATRFKGIKVYDGMDFVEYRLDKYTMWARSMESVSGADHIVSVVDGNGNVYRHKLYVS